MSTSRVPVLYSHWRSSCSWRVRIALKLKNIPYELKTLNLLGAQHTTEGGDQHRKEFEEINPMRLVPALQIDNTTLIDSLNIMQYLEETRPEESLLPNDALKRARIREICYVITSGIQPLQNVGVLSYVGKDRGLTVEWAQHWINRGFTALEKLLTKTADTYCVGDKISLADCCLVPQVYNARRYKVDVDQYSTIVRLEKVLINHPAFAETRPSRQPDCPPEARK